MEAFINYVLQFGNLNKQQTDFIMSKAKTLELHKYVVKIHPGSYRL